MKVIFALLAITSGSFFIFYIGCLLVILLYAKGETKVIGYDKDGRVD